MLRDAAQAMQADSLWVVDHFLSLYHPEIWRQTALGALQPEADGYFDPFCVCAALGPTTDLPLGIGVTDATRRAAPDIARAALTLQHLCKGGFNLGVGSGEAENLVPFGYPFDRPVAATEAFLKLLRHFLDTGRMPTGPGRTGLPLESSNGKPRVWVAGHGPRMLRLTGEYGDGWLPTFPATADEYGRRAAIVAAHAHRVGRPSPEAGLGVFLVLGENRQRIREMFEAEPLAKLIALQAKPEIFRRHGVEHPLGADVRGVIDFIPHEHDPDKLRALAPTIPFDVVEECLFLGNVDEVAQRLRGYADNGCEHAVLLNLTGLVGGVPEVTRHAPDLGMLRQRLSELTPRALARPA
jgi:phthiodiolone/phenolphthiodiolone dimycocerosates ketoreductase